MKRFCILLITVIAVFHTAIADKWAPEKSHSLALAQSYITSKTNLSERILDELFEVCVYEEPENNLWCGMFICKDIPTRPYDWEITNTITKKPSFIIRIKNNQDIECENELSTLVDEIREYYQYITEYNALCDASEYWEHTLNCKWIFWTPTQKADFYALYQRYPYQADFNDSDIYIYPSNTSSENEAFTVAMQYVQDLELDPDQRCTMTGSEYISSDSRNLWGINGYEFKNNQWHIVYVISLDDNYNLCNYYAFDSSGELSVYKKDD